MEVNLLHPLKQKSASHFKDEGSVTEVKLLHPKKQLDGNEVTDGGIVMEVNPLQPLKQSSSIYLTEYSTPSSPLTFSGTMISPEYFPSVLGKSVAVFVSEFKS